MSSSPQSRPSVPDRSAPAWKTPMFEQYWKIRDTLRAGTLLFYRMGDFYELFGEDAVAAAPILEIQLTARQKDADVPIPMCGIPAHSWESYGEKLLRRGQRIALCEQTTPPDAGKLVERKVIRVLTPGLPVDFRHLDAKEPHWLLAVAPLEAGTFEVIACDLLAGTLHRGRCADRGAVLSLRQVIRPKEILIHTDHRDLWQETFASDFVTLSDGASDVDAIFWSYLEYTQCKARAQVELVFPYRAPLEELQSQRTADYASLSAQVVSQWDVDPHLFALLDGCGSAIGSRSLRQLLHRPLARGERIRWRQSLVASFGPLAKSFLEASREVYDLERIMGRFRLEVVKPRELIRLTASLTHLAQALAILDWSQPVWEGLTPLESLTPWTDERETIEALVARLRAALDLEVDLSRSKNVSDLFRAGFDTDLDELRGIAQNSEAWLEAFEQKLRDRLSIPTLKVRYNRVFGFYIEVTKAHADKVPADFERRQTMVNAQRFSCDELKREEEKILSASTRLEDRAAFLVEQLTKEVLDHDESLQKVMRLFGFFDALAGALTSIDRLKRFGPWTVPTVQDAAFYFDIKNGRHPLVEALASPGAFVPNSLRLDEKLKLIVLTGPNMAGKSTLMRQTGLLLLLAQIGLPVPAESMSFAPCDGFYSRMGASDKILEGDSTFMVEMKETAQILAEATSQSLVLIDEIGRGTSTQDGLAIAHALLEHIHHHLGACTIFATHYHELSDLVPTLPRAQNASMEIREWKGELIFLRKLVPVAAASSHGIYVAELAGLPRDVLGRARELFAHPAAPEGLKVAKRSKGETSEAQLSIFLTGAPERVEVVPEWATDLRKDLGELNLNEMSPRETWDFLDRLRSRLPASN
ncbi:MAG TPA: DNA mismatch repair protein MutS [Bdellovibrionota bacterium]|nr:DNA mismatch repair protein MutS [Bdellovibrionota bacterium]